MSSFVPLKRTLGPPSGISGFWRRARHIAVFALALAAPMHGLIAQQATITPNYKDADLAQIVEAVSAITGRNFIIDPRVRAQVTMLSATPMTPDAFYQAFLSILQVHGFTAQTSGDVTKIIPDANARQVPGVDLPDRVSATSDEVVTQVVAVRNINAVQLVPILRPLIPQQGHLAAYPASNMLIISDRANNVNRIMRIIERIDQGGDEEIDIIQLQNASAAEIVRVVNTLFAAGAQAEGGAPALMVKVVADDRSNSVLVTGEQSQRLRIKTLITHLDTPLESGGDTQVRYLHYADAETIATKLKEQIQGVTAAAPGGPAPQGGAAAADRSVTIWADVPTNALVITAPPKMMRSVMSIVDKLDIRRAQVQVEAIIVEISADKVSELGLNWAVEGTNSSGETIPLGVFNQSVGGVSLLDILRGIDDPDTITTVPRGLTLAGGRFEETGTNFAVMMRALRDDANTNIISTPSIVTMDNEEAEIKITQEVPFVTGQYTNTSGGTDQGVVNPFQTIQRQEVGTILKITPQINDSGSVLMKIEQEASSLAQGTSGAVDLITNKRTINTQVLVDDGGIIVLGGLIEDNLREGENRVPILGAIPLVGELFKTRSVQKVKTNLMVFIRPAIIRDGVQAAFETNSKYNLIRNQQLERRNGRVTLLPGERQPTLPPVNEVSRYPDPTAGAEPPAAAEGDQDKKAEDSEPETTTPPARPRPFGPR